MTEYWWRSWHGAPMDHKWAVIAARSGVKVGVVSAIAWALFDYASQHKERGTVEGFDVETYSVYSGFTIDEVEEVIRAMNDKGVIKDGRLSAWDKRQPKSDKEVQRVTEWRKKKREKEERYEMLQGVTESYTDTDTDTDTDTESDTEKEKELNDNNGGMDYEFGALCSIYEKNIGVLTPRIAETIENDLKEFGLQMCMDAVTEALRNNVRKWSYVQGVLKNWKINGRKDPPDNGSGPKTIKVDFGGIVEERTV